MVISTLQPAQSDPIADMILGRCMDDITPRRVFQNSTVKGFIFIRLKLHLVVLCLETVQSADKYKRGLSRLIDHCSILET